MKKYVYMIEFDWSVEDDCNVETELFSNYEKADIHEYKCPVDLFDKKYRYKVEVKPKKRNDFFD